MPTVVENQPDYVGLLIRRWKVLVVCAVLGAAAGVTYALTAQEWFAATLTVVPSQRRETGPALGLATKLPDSLTNFATDLQRIQTVLTSASVADEVIAKFNLAELWGTAHPEHTRESLAGRCRTSVNKKAGLVALTCEDTDPKFALALASSFGEIGNRVFARISTSTAGEERRFLETQVEKSRRSVEETSRKLREFQLQHKIIDLPEQSKAVISAMASIQGDLLSKQLELTYLSGFSSPTEASVVQLRKQIAIMQAKLQQLESSAATPAKPVDQDKGQDFFPEAMTVPELRFKLEELTREQKIQETVYARLIERYELAKVDEARDTSTFQILDSPTLPTIRSRPHRKKFAITGFGAGVAVGLAWIVVPVWWRRRLQTRLPA